MCLFVCHYFLKVSSIQQGGMNEYPIEEGERICCMGSADNSLVIPIHDFSFPSHSADAEQLYQEAYAEEYESCPIDVHGTCL